MTEKTLYSYSSNYENRSFDERSLNKPISDLTLEDLNWCLRNRLFLQQVIDIMMNKIEENWEKIDQYYPSQICQWYDAAIQEIITIPFSFWDSRIECFEKICQYIDTSKKRPLKVESKIVKMFLNHKPKLKCWTNDDSKNFLENISYALNLDLAGNLIEAIKHISEIKYALMYGQSVYVEPLYKSISKVEELYEFIRDEFSDIGEDIIEEHLILGLEQEKLITVTNSK